MTAPGTLPQESHGSRRQHFQRDAPGVRRSGAPSRARPRHLEDPDPSQAPDHRVVPDPDGQRRDRGLHRLPRPVQHHARPGQGRHPLSPRRDARRGHGARGLDDVEVRRRAHPVRRRQGRRHLRSRPGCRAASSKRSPAATSPRSSTRSAPTRTSPRPTSTPTTRSWRGSWTPTACTSATPRRRSSPASRSRWADRSDAAKRPGAA